MPAQLPCTQNIFYGDQALALMRDTTRHMQGVSRCREVKEHDVLLRLYPRQPQQAPSVFWKLRSTEMLPSPAAFAP